MSSFIVETYKLRLEITRVGNPAVTHRQRIIELASRIDHHGIVVQAMLNFSTYFDSWSTPAVVGIFNTSNPYQPVLTGWLPSSEYALWYDVLRSEKPLYVFFDITQIGGADYVNRIALGTSTESPGEGPLDFDNLN